MLIKKLVIGWTAALTPTVLLTSWMVKAAYIQRGYHAIGGEWMLLPFVLLLLIYWTVAKVEAYRRYEAATRTERMKYHAVRPARHNHRAA